MQNEETQNEETIDLEIETDVTAGPEVQNQPPTIP